MKCINKQEKRSGNFITNMRDHLAWLRIRSSKEVAHSYGRNK